MYVYSTYIYTTPLFPHPHTLLSHLNTTPFVYVLSIFISYNNLGGSESHRPVNEKTKNDPDFYQVYFCLSKMRQLTENSCRPPGPNTNSTVMVDSQYKFPTCSRHPGGTRGQRLCKCGAAGGLILLCGLKFSRHLETLRLPLSRTGFRTHVVSCVKEVDPRSSEEQDRARYIQRQSHLVNEVHAERPTAHGQNP